uniref:EGF-like domain-containing protein n=1 Tax=Heterorhabditis bacteriophora TaxID=37862 RepID=A0A1I7XRF2_HETBA
MRNMQAVDKEIGKSKNEVLRSGSQMVASNWPSLTFHAVFVSQKQVEDENVHSTGASESVEHNTIEEVKTELERAVKGLNRTVTDNAHAASNAIITAVNNIDTCSPVDCNNRGTCLGTKGTFICACQLGYSGRTCEDTICDSVRDCNGRGLCLGTTAALTCLCNFGYTGHRCETLLNFPSIAFLRPLQSLFQPNSQVNSTGAILIKKQRKDEQCCGRTLNLGCAIPLLTQSIL